MNIIQKINKETDFSVFTGNNSSERNTHNVALSRIKETNLENFDKIDPILSKWAEGFEILFPDNQIFLDILKKKILKLMKKINELPINEWNKISKEHNFEINFLEIKNFMFKFIFCEFIIELKLCVNKFENYFEPVEIDKLNNILSVDHVFKYIKEMESLNCLDGLLGVDPSKISNWKKEKKNFTINALLKIKNNMLGKNPDLGLKIIEEKKVNTYCFLIYCTILSSRFLKGINPKDFKNGHIWISFFHTYSEGIIKILNSIFKK